MAKVKYQNGEEAIEVDATTQEMGEVAGAMGVELQAPSVEETQIAGTMLEQDQDQNTSMVGEAGPREANLISAGAKKIGLTLDGWFSKEVVKRSNVADIHKVTEPIDRITDTMVEATMTTGDSINPVTPTPVQAGEVPTDALGSPGGAAPEATVSPLAQATPMTQTEIDTVAAGLRTSDLNDYDTTDQFQINFNTVEDDDIMGMMANLAEANRVEIEAARGYAETGGVHKDEQLYLLADELGQDPEFVAKAMTKTDGTMYHDSEVLAIRQMRLKATIRMKQLGEQMRNGEATPEINAEFDKVLNFFNKISAPFMGSRAEVGRAQRAQGIPTGIPGEDESKEAMELILNMGNRGLSRESIATAITLADDVRGVGAVAEQVTPRKLRVAYDTAYESFINGILSGFTTHLINASGSALRITVDIADTAVASMMGSGNTHEFNKLGGAEWRAKIIGLQTSYKESLHLFGKYFSEWDTQPYGGVDKIEANQRRKVIKAETYGVDPDSDVGRVINGTGHAVRFMTERVMGGTDAYFKKQSERASLTALAYRRVQAMSDQNGWDEATAKGYLSDLLANPTEEMKQEAINHGLDMTFQTDLQPWLKEGQQWISSTPIANFFFPFIKTPANLMTQGFIERSALGLLWKDQRAALMAPGARGQMARSKFVTGTMGAAMIYNYALDDKVTGSRSTDRSIQAARDAAGWKPRSLKFTNDDGSTTYVSYDRMEPFTYILTAAADMAEFYKERKYTRLDDEDEIRVGDIATATVSMFSENIVNKTFMTGIRDVMEALDDPKRFGANYFERSMNSILPFSGLRRNVRTLRDDRMSNPDGVGEYISDQWALIESNTPLRVDLYGEYRPRDTYLVPWKPVNKKKDRVKDEVLDLTVVLEETVIPKFNDSINGAKLTNKEWEKIAVYARKEQKIKGLTFKEALTYRINHVNYKGMAPSQRAEILRDTAKMYDNAAEEHFVKTDKDFYAKYYKKYDEMRIRQLGEEKGIKGDLLKRLYKKEREKTKRSFILGG